MDPASVAWNKILHNVCSVLRKVFIIAACGTSYHAGLIGEYMLGRILPRIPVEVEYASEFRYRDPIITDDHLVIAISQSGETADTLAALLWNSQGRKGRHDRDGHR